MNMEIIGWEKVLDHRVESCVLAVFDLFVLHLSTCKPIGTRPRAIN